MDQATIQILVIVAMLAFGYWWLNRDLPQSVFEFGDELTAVPQVTPPGQ